MAGLDPGIHAIASQHAEARAEWIAGSSPAMTAQVAAGAGVFGL
jgi:hypothetical protein